MSVAEQASSLCFDQLKQRRSLANGRNLCHLFECLSDGLFRMRLSVTGDWGDEISRVSLVSVHCMEETVARALTWLAHEMD